MNICEKKFTENVDCVLEICYGQSESVAAVYRLLLSLGVHALSCFNIGL